MSVAARAARFAMVAIAIASFSIGGLAGPPAAFAASGESAGVVSAARSAVSGQSAQSPVSTAQVARTRLSQRERIVRITESHLDAHYRFGAEGQHNTFDCSGLVYAVYKEAGLLDKIGGIRRGARGYYHWFKRRGLASRTNPKPGDLVIWHKGTHIGIYIGNGEIISALNRKYGVRIHGLNFVSGFTAYLHVRISGKVPSGGGTTETIKVKTTIDDLVMRDGPGIDHDQVKVLDRGTVMTALGKTKDSEGHIWVHAKLASGKEGWVRARHVKVVQ